MLSNMISSDYTWDYEDLSSVLSSPKVQLTVPFSRPGRVVYFRSSEIELYRVVRLVVGVKSGAWSGGG